MVFHFSCGICKSFGDWACIIERKLVKMHLFGLTFVLFLLKLSAGNGMYYHILINCRFKDLLSVWITALVFRIDGGHSQRKRNSL